MYINEAAVRAALREFCDKYKTKDGKSGQGKAAKALGVTAAQLSLTLNGKNNVIPARILKKLGYRAVTVYEQAGSKKAKTAKPLSEHNKAFKNAGIAAAKRAAKKAPKKRRSTTPEQRAGMRQARSGVNKAHIVNETVQVQEKPRSARMPADVTVIDFGAED